MTMKPRTRALMQMLFTLTQWQATMQTHYLQLPQKAMTFSYNGLLLGFARNYLSKDVPGEVAYIIISWAIFFLSSCVKVLFSPARQNVS
eukprot:m.213171 g.213171  ORF g.213171 m.213171 type:complete len:89 (-) comp10760_c0_seq1:2497-2763(-)